MNNKKWLVEANQLVVKYGANIVIQPSTFKIPSTGVTAIIGPNGSGKSTLLHTIVGIVKPASGYFRVMGSSSKTNRKNIAYVMQLPGLSEHLPITVKQVVSMGRYSELGLWKRFKKSDHTIIDIVMKQLDIEHLASRRIDELSGGQRQRVYVAQSIAQNHEALLLDEPLTGLDLKSAKIIDDIIHSKYNQNQAVVLSTHDLNEAAASDHVVLMNHKVVASGPPSKVITYDNLEKAYSSAFLHGDKLPLIW